MKLFRQLNELNKMNELPKGQNRLLQNSLTTKFSMRRQTLRGIKQLSTTVLQRKMLSFPE